MNKATMKESLLRFGPFLLYTVETVLWSLAVTFLVLGTDWRHTLGVLSYLSVPVFGLFLVGSIIAHTTFMFRRQYGPILTLLIVNILGTIGFLALAFYARHINL